GQTLAEVAVDIPEQKRRARQSLKCFPLALALVPGQRCAEVVVLDGQPRHGFGGFSAALQIRPKGFGQLGAPIRMAPARFALLAGGPQLVESIFSNRSEHPKSRFVVALLRKREEALVD